MTKPMSKRVRSSEYSPSHHSIGVVKRDMKGTGNMIIIKKSLIALVSIE